MVLSRVDAVPARVARQLIGPDLDSWERPVSIAGTVWATTDRVLKVQSDLDVADVAGETALLHRLPAPTMRPDVLDFGVIEDRAWLLMRRMPGRTARDCWEDLEPKSRERLLRGVTRLLGERSGVDYSVVEGATRLGLPWPLRATESPESAKRALEEAASTGALTDTQLTQLAEIFNRGFAVTPPAPQIAHGNLHLGNVLCDPATGMVTGLVDWEMATWGPSDIDLDELLRTLTHPTLGVIADDRPWPRAPLGVAREWIAGEAPHLMNAPGAWNRLRAYQASFLVIRVPRRHRWSPHLLPPVLASIDDLVAGRSHLDE